MVSEPMVLSTLNSNGFYSSEIEILKQILYCMDGMISKLDDLNKRQRQPCQTPVFQQPQTDKCELKSMENLGSSFENFVEQVVDVSKPKIPAKQPRESAELQKTQSPKHVLESFEENKMNQLDNKMDERGERQIDYKMKEMFKKPNDEVQALTIRSWVKDPGKSPVTEKSYGNGILPLLPLILPKTNHTSFSSQRNEDGKSIAPLIVRGQYQGSSSFHIFGENKVSSPVYIVDFSTGKLDLPMYKGQNAFERIYRVERHFEKILVAERDKLSIAYSCMTESAIPWLKVTHDWENLSCWQVFKEHLLIRTNRFSHANHVWNPGGGDEIDAGSWGKLFSPVLTLSIKEQSPNWTLVLLKESNWLKDMENKEGLDHYRNLEKDYKWGTVWVVLCLVYAPLCEVRFSKMVYEFCLWDPGGHSIDLNLAETECDGVGIEVKKSIHFDDYNILMMTVFGIFNWSDGFWVHHWFDFQGLKRKCKALSSKVKTYVGRTFDNKCVSQFHSWDPGGLIVTMKALDIHLEDKVSSSPGSIVKSAISRSMMSKRKRSSMEKGCGNQRSAIKKELVVKVIDANYKSEGYSIVVEEVFSMIFIKMCEFAEAYLLSSIRNMVFIIPTYASNSQNQATKDAGVIDGLKAWRSISELTATAITYDLNKKATSARAKDMLIFVMSGRNRFLFGAYDELANTKNSLSWNARHVKKGKTILNMVITKMLVEVNKAKDIALDEMDKVIATILKVKSELSKGSTLISQVQKWELVLVNFFFTCKFHMVEIGILVTRKETKTRGRYVFHLEDKVSLSRGSIDKAVVPLSTITKRKLSARKKSS